jgi:DNA topoisomerase-1
LYCSKDFRTWAGTLIAAVILAELGATEDPKLAQKNVISAIDEVAHRLGNTRHIARASYISPRVIDHYLEGSAVAHYGKRLEVIFAVEQENLTEKEKALLELLKKKLRRDLRSHNPMSSVTVRPSTSGNSAI